MSRPDPLCPSAAAEEGGLLLGLVTADGEVAYLGEPLPVTADFVDAAAGGRSPAARFRVAAPCVEAGCAHWRGEGGCGVAAAAVEDLAAEERPLPRCGIRPRCRWFRQEGPAACATCALVVTAPSGSPAQDPVTTSVPPRSRQSRQGTGER